MRTAHQRAAVVTAIVLGLATPTAVAANAAVPNKGATTSAAAKAAHKPTHPVKAAPKPVRAAKVARAKHARNKFVSAGTVTAVNVATGTITFTVHGGRDKALRGKPLTVTLTATTKIRRNDAGAKLADVVVGDHVNVKGTKKAGVYTATRVAACKAGAETDKD